MMTQTKGKIFPADQRGLTELDWFRSYNSFNFGRYYDKHKTPFGALYTLNEDTLAAGRTCSLKIEEASDIILLPVTGCIAYKDDTGKSALIEAGQVQVLPMKQGNSLQISNPCETGLVKFLQCWIKTPGKAFAPAADPFPRLRSFDLDADKNKLIECFPPAEKPRTHWTPYCSHTESIGKFSGRQEAVYKITNPFNGVFAFVIEGAFEVQNRLLQTGDGLGLWDQEDLEMQALSDNAIILLLEVAL